MKALEFQESVPASPLWRPSPGATYYMPLDSSLRETPEVWLGGDEDEKRLQAGLVFRSLGRAHTIRSWAATMVKLWQLSALFEGQAGEKFAIGVLGQELTPYLTAMVAGPTFPNEESAAWAIEQLTTSERNALIRGPLWI